MDKIFEIFLYDCEGFLCGYKMNKMVMVFGM